MDYHYQLQPYKGALTRHKCPACGEPRQFSLYIDVETGEPLATHVGKCNRLDKCGYHHTPKQYFAQTGLAAPNAPAHKPKTVQKPASYIAPEVIEQSLKCYAANHFATYLQNLFGGTTAQHLLRSYRIGTSKHWQGATVFWQIDSKGNVHAGKIMLYDATTGKRVKIPFNHITWVHNALQLPDYNLKQCLFGEHLLALYPHKPVAIVESEKTAVIASVYMPAFNWLATGGAQNLNKQMLAALQGKRVVLFPDVNQYQRWQHTAANILLPDTQIAVSKLLEERATHLQKQLGADLADILVKPDPATGWALTDYDYPVMWNEVDDHSPHPLTSDIN